MALDESLHRPLLAPPPVGQHELIPSIRITEELCDGRQHAPEEEQETDQHNLDGNEENIMKNGDTGMVGSIIILAKTIIGAGSAALPLAFARLGSVVGISFLLLVGFMTHFSIEAISFGLVAARERSYPAAVRRLLGPTAGWTLHACLVLRCAGLMTVYIMIAADMLAGNETGDMSGLLCEFSGLFGGDQFWWCDNRALVAAVVTLVILGPMVWPRKLSSSAWVSYVGLAAVGVWVTATLALVMSAALRNELHMLPWLPSSKALGGGGLAADSVIALATIPVIATAFTCQMTVAFVATELRGFTFHRIGVVSAVAVSICSSAFLLVGLGSVVAFGSGVPADVLQTFSSECMIEFFGDFLGPAIGGMVRLGFLTSVLANMPLQMLPYRESLTRIVLGNSTTNRTMELRGIKYALATYASLAVFYAVAMTARSIWVPLQVVGATAGAAIAFIFPAALAIAGVRAGRYAEAVGEPAGKAAAHRSYWVGNAWCLVALGALQLVTGLAAVAVERGKEK